MKKMKRVRISNSRLNSYGTRVLTEGVDTGQYQRNPVLLYMHERGQVIGMVKDIRVEDDDITGELVFDQATELSRQCKKQYEFGSLRMVSAGLDVLETSEEKEFIVEGQTRPTITRSKLFEVSLVDIGANDDAIVLQRDGKKIELGKGGDSLLPMLNFKHTEMDFQKLALSLGLPEGADEAAVATRITELMKAEKNQASLVKENEALTLSAITAVVDGAVMENRISADKKDHFVELGKKVGMEELKNIFSAMSPRVKLASVVNPHDDASGASAWKTLSDVPSDKMMTLRQDEPETYRRLYKAEYGIDCVIE